MTVLEIEGSPAQLRRFSEALVKGRVGFPSEPVMQTGYKLATAMFRDRMDLLAADVLHWAKQEKMTK